MLVPEVLEFCGEVLSRDRLGWRLKSARAASGQSESGAAMLEFALELSLEVAGWGGRPKFSRFRRLALALALELYCSCSKSRKLSHGRWNSVSYDCDCAVLELHVQPIKTYAAPIFSRLFLAPRRVGCTYTVVRNH